MIRLLINYYDDPVKARMKELKKVSRRNEEHPLIGQVNRVYGRATFDLMFKMANQFITSEEDISIICNSDIYFNETLEKVNSIKPNECYALGRWDEQKDGSLVHFNFWDTQDAWIFRGKIGSIDAPFPPGIAGCDNRLAHEIRMAGYNILNPSLTIQACHLHLTNFRRYDKPDFKIDPALEGHVFFDDTRGIHCINQPYLLVPPIQL